MKWTRLTLPSHHRTRRLHLQPTPALAREPKTDSPQRERLLAVSEPSLDLAQGPARGSEDDHVSLLQQACHGPTAVAHPERINQAHIERTTARRQARTRRSGRIHRGARDKNLTSRRRTAVDERTYVSDGVKTLSRNTPVASEWLLPCRLHLEVLVYL